MLSVGSSLRCTFGNNRNRYTVNEIMYPILSAVLVSSLGAAATTATQVGVTHTKPSLDPWNEEAAVARGEELLSSGAIRFQVWEKILQL